MNRRPLHGWLTAEAVSLTGTRLSMVAIPWLVLTTTGSAGRTGLVALVELTPLVLLKVLGGPVIDRLGARRVAITCDLGSVVVVGLVPLLHVLDLLHFGLLLALVGVAGALRGPGDAAKHALVPTVAEATDVPMERVTGLHGTVDRTASLLGGALAGGLIAWLGAANALVVDAASFAISALLLLWATAGLPAVADAHEADRAPYLRQLREGWQFLRHERVILAIAVMVAITNVLDTAWGTVLMPVWAREYGAGAAGVGLVFALWGGAAAAGSVVAATWAHRLPRFPLYLGCFLLVGAPRYAVFAWDTPLWAVVAVVVVGGFASGFLNPILGAVIFERIPAGLTGRVSSMTTAMCFALMPLGGVLGGGLVTWWGLTAAMLAIGGAYFVATMLPAVDRSFRELDRRPGVPGPAAAAEPRLPEAVQQP